ncbi:MAG: FGGY-family carbohydrate kinase [Clostridia bacterium]|nr:FGGY-family carbohydrate kinase [Clostridia bacterium]
MKRTVLSLDCGTQSIRAMLFDEEGNLLGKVKETFVPYFSPQEGFAEQEPILYWQKLCSATNKLKAECKDIWDTIIGITVTTMRDVGICIDKDNKPLRPCILWMDRRKAKCEKKLPLRSRVIFKISGMTDVVKKNRVDCKSNWIQENEPDIWAKTEKYIQLSTYINYMLCGNLKDSVASMIGHIPFNYKPKSWMSAKHFQMPLFNIEQSKLFDLVDPGCELGKITFEAAEATGIKEGLPLVASGSDKGCETIGTGAIYPHTASISFGTTATVQITTDKYVEPITFLPAYPAVYPNRYNPEIMVVRGYWMLTWFMKEFLGKNPAECYERTLDKQLDTVPPCCDGLFVEPYWGAGLKYPEARGAIVGFCESHTMLHVYRAIIEGINFALYEGMLSLQKKSGVKIQKIMVSGGGAQSDEVCKLTANLFGLPVARAQTYETSGLGAAICAFAGLGVYQDCDEAMKKMVRISAEFLPDPQVHAVYKNFFEKVYKKCYKRLKPTFCAIKNI